MRFADGSLVRRDIVSRPDIADHSRILNLNSSGYKVRLDLSVLDKGLRSIDLIGSTCANRRLYRLPGPLYLLVK
jgi:hypothetical protein